MKQKKPPSYLEDEGLTDLRGATTICPLRGLSWLNAPDAIVGAKPPRANGRIPETVGTVIANP